MSNTATKVTSVDSASGAPSPPQATPRTEASGSVDFPPNTDFDAVGRILGPIQEDLNESADAAMYPSPPINTPEAFSPAPSVYKGNRGRGLSTIGDRLAQLKLEERGSSHKDTDVTSSSRSVTASIEENEGEEGDDVSSTSGSIPIVLGSPVVNPRLEEYLNFTSNDLPVTNTDNEASSSTQAATGNESSHSRERSIKSAKSDGAASGVTEKSTWAEEVEDAAERAIMQLEQLATDEFIVNPSRSFEDYYTARLARLLAGANRKVKLDVQKKE